MSKFIFALAATAATALTVAVATPALAQSKDDFSGFRLEALAGYDHISTDDDGLDGDNGIDGVSYGVAGGYDFAASNRLRLGIEGEIADSTASDTSRNVLVAGDRLKTTAGRDLYIGGRVGYVLSPSTMIYGKLGYTNQRVGARYTAGTTTLRDHENLDGIRVGAGVEHMISKNVYLKGEYRYSHYGNNSDADRHQLMAGVGYRF